MTTDDGRPLTLDSVITYIAGRPDLASHVGEVVDVELLGGGKINAVFVARGVHGSLVLKQALPWVRVLPDWPLTSDRILREADGLAAWSASAPNSVPEVYALDVDRRVLSLAYLEGYRLWRESLGDGEVEPSHARAVGAAIAGVAIASSANAVGPVDYSQRLRRGLNPAMDLLMEDVVFDCPFTADDPRNTQEPVLKRLRDDACLDNELLEWVRMLKSVYRTRHESLIHGDLHTGSLMVLADVRMIDAEFCRFGPVSWDLGELMGHFRISAACRAALGDSGAAAGILALADELWAAFETQYTAGAGGGPWLAECRQLSIRFAGLEILRRIVGIGDCEELTALPASLRDHTATILVHAARQIVKDGKWS